MRYRRTRSLLLSAGIAAGCAPAGPPLGCADLGSVTRPARGRRVEVTASMVGLSINIGKGGSNGSTTNVWRCRRAEGSTDQAARFAFLDSDATWTEAAGKANSIDSALVVTGVVGDTGAVLVGGRSEPVLFLKKVRMRLTGEAADARD